MENDTPGIPQAAYPDTIDGLRSTLLNRLDRHSFDACSRELLRALIAVFDLAAPPPPTQGVRPRLRIVR